MKKQSSVTAWQGTCNFDCQRAPEEKLRNSVYFSLCLMHRTMYKLRLSVFSLGWKSVSNCWKAYPCFIITSVFCACHISISLRPKVSNISGVCLMAKSARLVERWLINTEITLPLDLLNYNFVFRWTFRLSLAVQKLFRSTDLADDRKWGVWGFSTPKYNFMKLRPQRALS